MGVAHVEAGDRAALQVAEEGPSGQRVVGVPAHGATVQGSAGRPGSRFPASARAVRRPDVHLRSSCVYSCRYIGAIYRHTLDRSTDRQSNRRTAMLDLAILGLLKEQPLHGYELKKRLGETLGSLWGISYGSLYPALRRLERDGSIEIVEPDDRGRADPGRPARSTATSRPPVSADRPRPPAAPARPTASPSGATPALAAARSTTTPPATTSAPSR